MAKFNLTPRQITDMADVLRWHTRRPLREQSVAEHSHQVALLAYYIAPDGLSIEDRLTVLELALVHDAHETMFGDIPTPARRILAEDGLDIDAHCRYRFCSLNSPYDHAPAHVRNIVEAADKVERALFADRFLPDIAREIIQEAIAFAQEHLNHAGFVRVLSALGVTN